MADHGSHKRKRKSPFKRAAEILHQDRVTSEFEPSEAEKRVLTTYTIARLDEEGLLDEEDSLKQTTAKHRRKKKKK